MVLGINTSDKDQGSIYLNFGPINILKYFNIRNVSPPTYCAKAELIINIHND